MTVGITPNMDMSLVEPLAVIITTAYSATNVYR